MTHSKTHLSLKLLVPGPLKGQEKHEKVLAEKQAFQYCKGLYQDGLQFLEYLWCLQKVSTSRMLSVSIEIDDIFKLLFLPG